MSTQPVDGLREPGWWFVAPAGTSAPDAAVQSWPPRSGRNPQFCGPWPIQWRPVALPPVSALVMHPGHCSITFKGQVSLWPAPRPGGTFCLGFENDEHVFRFVSLAIQATPIRLDLVDSPYPFRVYQVGQTDPAHLWPWTPDERPEG